MRIAYDLDTRLRSVANIDTARHADLANAKVAQTLYLELRPHHDTEAATGVRADGHVHRDIGLVVAHVQLERAAADGKVGAL